MQTKVGRNWLCFIGGTPTCSFKSDPDPIVKRVAVAVSTQGASQSRTTETESFLQLRFPLSTENPITVERRKSPQISYSRSLKKSFPCSSSAAIHCKKGPKHSEVVLGLPKPEVEVQRKEKSVKTEGSVPQVRHTLWN